MFFFFFFSSRRRHTICALVTGVQTCALPILIRHRLSGSGMEFNDRLLAALRSERSRPLFAYAGTEYKRGEIADFAERVVSLLDAAQVPLDAKRSEERRVGKEWVRTFNIRGSPYT